MLTCKQLMPTPLLGFVNWCALTLPNMGVGVSRNPFQMCMQLLSTVAAALCAICDDAVEDAKGNAQQQQSCCTQCKLASALHHMLFGTSVFPNPSVQLLPLQR
jgi:hypothetical protein